MNDDHHRNLLELYDAILKLDNKSEVKNFFADLCTPAELKALQERWKVFKIRKLSWI